MQLAPSARVSCLYSPNCLEKLSEKSRTPLQRSLTGHRNDTFRAVLAFVYWPNLRSKPRSDPFSDSFLGFVQALETSCKLSCRLCTAEIRGSNLFSSTSKDTVLFLRKTCTTAIPSY